MSKTSSIEKNKRRQKLAKRFDAKRKRLKAVANDMDLTPEERFAARLKQSAKGDRHVYRSNLR